MARWPGVSTPSAVSVRFSASARAMMLRTMAWSCWLSPMRYTNERSIFSRSKPNWRR